MAKAKYVNDKKATAACGLRLAEEATRTTDVTPVDNCADNEHPIPKQTFLGNSWFTSVQAATELSVRGHHFISILKTSHSSSPKDFVSETMKDWPSGSHLLLQRTTRQEIDLCALGHKNITVKRFFSFYSLKVLATHSRDHHIRLLGKTIMATLVFKR